jgi:hypothetical protein
MLGTRLPYSGASLTVGATIVVWREEMVADRVPTGQAPNLQRGTGRGTALRVVPAQPVLSVR